MIALFAAALGIAGCGFDMDMMDSSTAMHEDLDRILQESAAAGEEATAHASTVTRATSAEGIASIEASHLGAMSVRLRELDRMLTNMSTYCRHPGNAELGRTHGMQSAVTAMRAELQEHQSISRATRDATIAEEDRHLRAMRALFGRMSEADAAAMKREAGFHACQHGNH